MVGLEDRHMVLVKDHQEALVAELFNREQGFVAQRREDMDLACGE